MYKKLLGIALIFAFTSAVADDLSYNFVELGYMKAELDDDLAGFDVDGDGFGIRGSFEINEAFFVALNYSALGFDFGVDLDQLSAGVGYHGAMSNGTDFFAVLSYLRAEVSASGFGSADEDGFGATVGVRGMLTDKVELNGRIGYADLGDGADGTSFGAGALYSFTDAFALGFDIEIDEDVTLYGLGGRFYFGN